MNEATRDYILQHREDDVRQLALKGTGKGEVDLPLALQQIAGWQVARRKVPTWAACDDVLYPPHLSMEQCSSEQTARYKASLLPSPSSLNAPRSARPEGALATERDARTLNPSPSTFIDLTGGFGVDFYFMAHEAYKSYTPHKAHKPVYVEQQEHLCDLARHNFALLGLDCTVVCASAADFLPQLNHADIIYLDPARRDKHGARTYSIEDCTPNVLELLPLLLDKADRILLKLSPMLDWHKAVDDLGCVSEVHIVSVHNECKELLLVLQQEPSDALRLICVNDGSVFETSPNVGPKRSQRGTETVPAWDQNGPSMGPFEEKGAPVDPSYLYEPNASIMKAGCFDEIADFYQVRELSANSHLFVSDHAISDFPGRCFRVEAVTTMNKQELKVALQGIDRANITVRNFPMSVDALRKKLRLKDGGDVYLFATTMSNGEHRLFVCRKAKV